MTIERFEKQIQNLQTKSDEDYREVYEAGRLAVISEMDETKKEKDENARLKKGMKKTKEMEDENARLKDDKARLEDDKARFEEEIRDVYEAWHTVCVSDSKNIRELKDEIEILEKEK